MFNDIFEKLNGRKKLVFLGGTCNDTTWRDKIIPKLDIDYFNPVVENWTPKCKEEELKVRATADYLLYVISPAMTGVYSIAEVTDDSNKFPKKTIFYYLTTDVVSGKSYKFTDGQIKSLDSVGMMVQSNGGKWFKSLDEIISYINS
jgi:hypothetical protein